jgi:hypothetical protein
MSMDALVLMTGKSGDDGRLAGGFDGTTSQSPRGITTSMR